MLAVMPAFLLALIFYSRFAMWVEGRPGVVLDDPLLALLPSINLTWPIFLLLYSSILIGLAMLVRSPEALLITFTAYTLLLVVRIVAMYVAPFASPDGMIVLADPVAGIGPGGALVNDLFFSGHTATVFLLYLTARRTSMRRFFLFSAVALGVMLLLQHVHNTVDVLAAPFFAYGCYRGALVLWNRSRRHLPT